MRATFKPELPSLRNSIVPSSENFGSETAAAGTVGFPYPSKPGTYSLYSYILPENGEIWK
jgi:hypothetical protein